MRNIIFPALVALATAGTLYAMSAAPSGQAEGESSVKLAVRDPAALTPYLHAAAKELGYAQPRGYDNGVFINAGDDKISFINEKGALTLHVALESRYHHSKSERPVALQGLKDKGRVIFETALQIQSRSNVRDQMATAPARRKTG